MGSTVVPALSMSRFSATYAPRSLSALAISHAADAHADTSPATISTNDHAYRRSLEPCARDTPHAPNASVTDPEQDERVPLPRATTTPHCGRNAFGSSRRELQQHHVRARVRVVRRRAWPSAPLRPPSRRIGCDLRSPAAAVAAAAAVCSSARGRRLAAASRSALPAGAAPRTARAPRAAARTIAGCLTGRRSSRRAGPLALPSSPQMSRKRTSFAYFWMNSLRGSTWSPMSLENDLLGHDGVVDGHLQQRAACRGPSSCPTAARGSSRPDPCSAGSRSSGPRRSSASCSCSCASL